MSRGGKREGAGRKKRNNLKNLVEVSPAVAIVKGIPASELTSGQSPLEYMLMVMRDRTVEWKRRDEMAKAAAPYVHGKVSERPAGKKDQVQAEADNAGRGSEWEGDLEFTGGRPN